jgi:hypothetical protein
MGIRENFQKLIDKKQQEITQLELQAREARAYIQALQDSMKFLPREGSPIISSEHSLRPDSALARAREAIKTAGTALPIAEILKAIGKPQDKKNRVSLAGTLSSYVRAGKVFTKTAPNTFGLLEFGSAQPDIGEADDLPEEFGKMQ